MPIKCAMQLNACHKKAIRTKPQFPLTASLNAPITPCKLLYSAIKIARVIGVWLERRENLWREEAERGSVRELKAVPIEWNEVNDN